MSAYNGQRWVSPKERSDRAKVVGASVTDYALRWISGRNIKPTTRRLYTDLLAKHITPSLGEIGIGALCADDVSEWYSTLLTGKPTARAHTYSLLHAICASAVEADLLNKNPCAIKRAMSTNRKREPVLLSVSELAAVADGSNRNDSRRWCCFRPGAHCDSGKSPNYEERISGKDAKSSPSVVP